MGKAIAVLFFASIQCMTVHTFIQKEAPGEYAALESRLTSLEATVRDTKVVFAAQLRTIASLTSQLKAQAITDTKQPIVQSQTTETAPIGYVQSRALLPDAVVKSGQTHLQNEKLHNDTQLYRMSVADSHLSNYSATIDQQRKYIEDLQHDLKSEKAKVSTLEKLLTSFESQTTSDLKNLYDLYSSLSSSTIRNMTIAFSIIKGLQRTLSAQSVLIEANENLLLSQSKNISENGQQIETLKKELRNHTATANEQEHYVSNALSSLRSDIISMKRKEQQYETELKSHQLSISSHSNSNRGFSNRLDSLEHKAQVQSDSLNQLTAQESALQTKLTNSIGNSNRRVGFYANFGGRGLQRFSEGQTVAFPNVITNEGQRYNKNSGVFTCNIAGIYVFHHSVGSDEDNFVTSTFKKNGVDVGYAEAVGADNDDDSGAMSIVITLRPGDRVWIVFRRITHSSHTISSSPIHYTTFSGFLV